MCYSSTFCGSIFIFIQDHKKKMGSEQGQKALKGNGIGMPLPAEKDRGIKVQTMYPNRKIITERKVVSINQLSRAQKNQLMEIS